MLKRVDVSNLTVFPEASFTFSRHLNVIIGENGLGKSHLMKAAYTVLAVSAEEEKKRTSSRAALQIRIADKLLGVFKPESVGRLATRQRGRSSCEVACKFDDARMDLSFGFSTASRSEVEVRKMPRSWLDKTPVFLPTRELLTIFPGFVSLYETYNLDFDETWRDTCILLGQPSLRGPREKVLGGMLRPLEDAMGGKIVLERDRFYLKIPGQGKMEMHLVAEGLRKLGMIARLIATGALLDQGYLFWDEPETNLNPALIKRVARTIINLAQSGIQVFIATHSLFLMRELDILLRSDFRKVSSRFFGLHPSKDGGATVMQGDSVDDIGSIAALDEQIQQSDRYLEIEG